MPPYIVFDDKCLVDMTYKAPTTKEEMLDVSGVGEVKYQKYGERFLEVIKIWKETNKKPVKWFVTLKIYIIENFSLILKNFI